MWVRNQSDSNKELSLINLVRNELIISYLTVQIDNQTCDWLAPTNNIQATIVDGRSLCNLSLKSGQIYVFYIWFKYLFGDVRR
jgi:hypothetical protein